MFRKLQFFLLCTVLARVFCKPNIILIITDDQDVRTGTTSFIPKLQRTLAEKGTSYERFYAPVSLCCPSRVSLLRAQHAHNHNVTYIGGIFGGYHVFCEKGYNGKYLPAYLQEVGYGTYYTGKLMNGLFADQIATQSPKGWTHSDFLVDPNAYLYYNASFSPNNSAPVSYEGQFQVDVVLDKALGLLDEALAPNQNDKPFFLGVAPTAPHLEVQLANGWFTEPIPRKGQENLFPDIKVPRIPSFNVKTLGAVSWLKELEMLNETVVNYIDHLHRQRLRVLQPVDELVEAIVKRVEQAGPKISKNTYIIYTSDNGYALGSHRRMPGKTLPYEEDVLVPLVIRGPNVPANATNTEDVYSMPDLGATILGLAGVDFEDLDHSIDGRDLLSNTQTQSNNKARHALVEYWNGGMEEGIYFRGYHNTTYRSIHVRDDLGKHNWVYGVWCTGERELYDLNTDPYQLHNLASNENEQANATRSFLFSSGYTTRIASRLDALLTVLKTCVGETCRDPWKALNLPQAGSSHSESLSGALDARFDTYFASMPKFGYKDCRYGYFGDANEYPTWSGNMSYR
ncbi:alkaline phosphatase-like protein [Marasmius fiardii PR-910]|nr:alkaline phosphatase-like protein [Marasmius fiardii PR-910]